MRNLNRENKRRTRCVHRWAAGGPESGHEPGRRPGSGSGAGGWPARGRGRSGVPRRSASSACLSGGFERHHSLGVRGRGKVRAPIPAWHPQGTGRPRAAQEAGRSARRLCWESAAAASQLGPSSLRLRHARSAEGAERRASKAVAARRARGAGDAQGEKGLSLGPVGPGDFERKGIAAPSIFSSSRQPT